MIYIEESSFEKRIYLLSEYSRHEPLEIVIWLYPESGIDSILEEGIFEPSTVNATPATTYEDGKNARCTQRLRLNDELINKIAQEKHTIMQHSDSLCIYNHNNPEWQACLIGHEGIILIKNNALLNKFKAIGFNTSLSAPSWW